MSWILEYFVVYLLCVYLYICSAGYVELPIFLLSVSHIIQNKKKLYKFIRSDISCVDIYIYIRLVMSSYLLFCCICFDAWCITCYPKQEETLEVCIVMAYICCIYFDAWCITCR